MVSLFLTFYTLYFIILYVRPGSKTNTVMVIFCFPSFATFKNDLLVIFCKYVYFKIYFFCLFVDSFMENMFSINGLKVKWITIGVIHLLDAK